MNLLRIITTFSISQRWQGHVQQQMEDIFEVCGVPYLDGWNGWKRKAEWDPNSHPFIAFMDAVHGTNPQDITVEAAVIRYGPAARRIFGNLARKPRNNKMQIVIGVGILGLIVCAAIFG
jgi:hypothetical protein